MSDEVRDLRTIHLCIPDDAPADEAEAFEEAVAKLVHAPSPREWDAFMHSHTEACEHSDHCYGPGSKAEAAIAARALREVADKWMHGQWADAPRRASRVEERIANGQHVGEWLRAHADAIEKR